MQERSQGIPIVSENGKMGQIAALKEHNLTSKEMTKLKTATFPILAIVGDKVRDYHCYTCPNIFL